MKPSFSLAAVFTFSTFVGLATASFSDEMSGMAMSTPSASQSMAQTTPTAEKTVKKTKKKAASKVVWVCPMGDYSGPRTKDGKCPKCGMDLVKSKAPAGTAPSATPSAMNNH
jgi:uncharacterized paraquat-inducible protein A